MKKEKVALSVEVGQRIVERRKQLGLTQDQASELAGVSQQFFACVERGLKNIRAENVVKISNALNISTDYILLGKSNETDYNHLIDLMKPLSEVQLKCLEEIIKNYVTACGHSDTSPNR